MVRYEIEGGRTLCGECRIQGSKNAVLPMMSAALLNKGCTVLHNCPKIDDVYCMIRIMEHMGCLVRWEGHTLIIDAENIRCCEVVSEESTKMRSSIILMGALLGRCRQAVLGEPGGCVIGARPIDFHLNAFRKMGADIQQRESYLWVQALELTGNAVTLEKPSVGATENILLAAVLAKGVTRIYNAAREPEIVELCRLLCAMGADIIGAGTSCILVKGVKRLHDAQITVMSDRIAAGTYMLAAAATGGEIFISNPPVGQLKSLLKVLNVCGVPSSEDIQGIHVGKMDHYRGIPFLETGPYPGFPTDLQSPLLAMLLKARGKSIIKENIFESRFRVVEEFRKLGAHVSCEGCTCVVEGVPALFGTTLCSGELRGGAALLIAGLMAEGKTTVLDGGYIQRGYEGIEEQLMQLGARITAKEEYFAGDAFANKRKKE